MSLKVYRPDGSYMGETVPLDAVPQASQPSTFRAPVSTGVPSGGKLPPGWKSLGCNRADPPTCRAQAPDGTIYYRTGNGEWHSASGATPPKPAAPSPGRAQPIQPPPQGNRLGEPAVSMDDLLQEAIDMLGKPEEKRAPFNEVAADGQQEWRWDGNKYVFTTAEDEKARQREAAIGELAKRREDMAKRKPNPYR